MSPAATGRGTALLAPARGPPWEHEAPRSPWYIGGVRSPSADAPTRLLSAVAQGLERLLPRTLRRGVPAALLIVAGLYALVFLACAAIRVTFGFELGWMESGVLAMTDRLEAHQSIYVAPSPAYV